MLSQLSPQGGVLGSPQSPVLQISGPIFHLNHKSINDSLSTFQKYNLVMFTAILPTVVLQYLPVIVFIPKDCNLLPLNIL